MSIQEYRCVHCEKENDFFTDEMTKNEDGTFISKKPCSCGHNSWTQKAQSAHVWVGRKTYSHAVIKPDSLPTRSLITQKCGLAALEEFQRTNEDKAMNQGNPTGEEKNDESENWIK